MYVRVSPIFNFNPFTAKDAIWRPGVITNPEINLSARYKFYNACCHPLCY